MRRYRKFVAIQSPTETRGEAGSVILTYTTVPGMERVPATIMVAMRETKEKSMTPTSVLYRIVLAGHRPEVVSTWAILDGSDRYDVIGRDETIGRRATIVLAEKVAP